MYFCASCAHLVPSEAGEGIGYPGAGLWMVVGHHMSIWNLTQVLGREAHARS